jgi:hypothetical protein
MRLFVVAFAVTILSCTTAGVVPRVSTSHRSPSRIHAHINDADTSTGNSLVPRFWDEETATDADFKKFAKKGGALICGLLGTDRSAGQLMKDKRDPPSAASVWSGNLRQELCDWYWHDVDTSSKACDINEFWKLSKAMQALGLDGKPKFGGGDNACYRVEHWDPNKQENGRRVPAINQWYTVGGTDYRVSFGSGSSEGPLLR